MNPMNYLFTAYVAIWLILAVYLFSIHSREKKLRTEIESVKQMLDSAGMGKSERGKA